jgi:hypothetical protein
MDLPSKTCIRCGAAKPLAAYYRHQQMKDGRLGACIECVKAGVRANRAAKIEHYRSYDRKRANDPERVAARAAYAQTEAARIASALAKRKWDVANAIRKRASTAVGKALRRGRLVAQPCFICGCRAEAHHPDYTAPLAVSWLCDAHHKQLHREHREAIREAA